MRSFLTIGLVVVSLLAGESKSSSISPHRHSINRFSANYYPAKITQLDSVRILCHIDEVHGTRPSNLPAHFTGKKVLFGIIDTEFDTHHPAFLNSNKETRFVALWDQTDTLPPNNRFKLGTIKNHQELIADPLFGSKGEPHGTHTASIAAGSDCQNGYQGVAPEVLIAGVTYNGLPDVINGIKWIFSLADSLNLPCVINLSIGISDGPHDGTSELDQFIDSVSKPGRIIVGAVGNDYAIGTHVCFYLNSNDTAGTIAKSISIVNNSDTIYYSGLEIWGQVQKPFSCDLLIFNTVDSSLTKISTFSTSHPASVSTQIPWENENGKNDTIELTLISERANNLNSKPHMRIKFETKSPSIYLAIKIQNTKGTNSTIHCWHRFRASLISMGLDNFLSGDKEYSVKEIGGTATKSIVAGAYYGRTSFPTYKDSIFPRPAELGQIAHFSSTGPTVDGRVKPDITAPGWSVIAAFGRNGKPDNNVFTIWPDITKNTGRYSEATGTSISAPIVAGVIALMLEAEPLLSPDTARAIIQSTAIRDEFTGMIQEPINRWGAGKINALGAMEKLLKVTRAKKHTKEQLKPSISMIISGKRFVISGYTGIGTLSIFNLQGKLIYCTPFNSSHELNLSSTLPYGLYNVIIRDQTKATVFCNKFTVLH